MKVFKRFIDVNTETHATNYSAGQVTEDDGRYLITYEQLGAAETFSIGQPVYDKSGTLMGYLGVTLLENLDYSADMRIPVEAWEVCLPTKACAPGKQVYTYWQQKMKETEKEDTKT